MSNNRTVADDAPTTTGSPVTIQQEDVRVSLFGSNEVRITVEGPGGLSVEQVLIMAAELLQVKLDTNRVGVVKNGEPAKLNSQVAAGDFVSGTPRAKNG